MDRRELLEKGLKGGGVLALAGTGVLVSSLISRSDPDYEIVSDGMRVRDVIALFKELQGKELASGIDVSGVSDWDHKYSSSGQTADETIQYINEQFNIGIEHAYISGRHLARTRGDIEEHRIELGDRLDPIECGDGRILDAKNKATLEYAVSTPQTR